MTTEYYYTQGKKKKKKKKNRRIIQVSLNFRADTANLVTLCCSVPLGKKKVMNIRSLSCLYYITVNIYYIYSNYIYIYNIYTLMYLFHLPQSGITWFHATHQESSLLIRS